MPMGGLTIITAPDAEFERDRDLWCSRQRSIQQQRDLRRHILPLPHHNGFHYKAESARKTRWRTHHYGWLARTIESCSGSRQVNLSLLLRQLKNPDEILAGCREEVEAPAPTMIALSTTSALSVY